MQGIDYSTVVIILDLQSPSFLVFLLERELMYRVQGLRLYRTKRSKARATQLIGILPGLGEGEGRRFTVMEA